VVVGGGAGAVSMIIQSAQVMDFTIAAIFGKSCAVPEFSPNPGFHCPPAVSGDITVFGPSVYLLSAGFLATAAVCLPLGFFVRLRPRSSVSFFCGKREMHP
jgi:hypothetical protein